MKISTKITGLVILIIAFNLIIGAFGVYQLVGLGKDISWLIEKDLAFTRDALEIANSHKTHTILFERAVTIGKNVKTPEGKQEFKAAIKEFQDQCMKLDNEIVLSAKSLNEITSGSLPTELRSKLKLVDKELQALNEQHDICQPRVKNVFTLLKKGQTNEAQGFIEEVMDEEMLMDQRLKSFIGQMKTITAETLEKTKAKEKEVITILLALSLISLLLGIGFSGFITSRIVRSLKHGAFVARRIAEGDRQVKIKKITNDESGQLLEAMKIMQTSLMEAEQSLKNVNEELEGKVKERTRELSKINFELMNEIEERKRTEKELQLSNRELNTFIYKTSHDLKGPVTSLQGLLQVADLDVKDPEARNYLSMLNERTELLDRILASLIRVTEIRQDDVDRKEIQFDQLIDEVLTDINGFNGADKVEKVVEIDTNKPFHSDRGMVATIIQQLSLNAIKFSQSNGEPSRLILKVNENADGINLSVKDNGIGIPEDQQTQVFDMFFKGTQQVNGAGLGLYMVQNAVSKLKGKINLESEENKGTVIDISLPDLKAS